mgnify:CR=1 FL=1
MGHGFGLCDSCAHQRLVRSGRGTLFSLCERALADDRYLEVVEVLEHPAAEKAPAKEKK